MNTPLRFLLAQLLIPVVLPASASMGQIVAFQADFNLDAIGEQPSSDPPGDPLGDEILITTSGGILTVEASFGVMNDKPVVLDRRSSGSLNLRTHLDPALQNCQTYKARWTAMLNEVTDNVSIGAYSQTGLMGALYYDDGGVLLYNLVALETGYQANVPQTFELTVDIPAKTTSLSIDGYADPNAQNVPFSLLNYTETFMRLFFSLGGFDYEEFAIDDIEIVATECSVSADPTSWSAMKSRYQ